jgi:hypothetical protein
MRYILPALLLVSGFALAGGLPAQAQAENPVSAEEPNLPGTEEAPGFEDFEKGDLSPQDIREEQERQEDRDVISPSMQDGEPLPGMDAD